MDMRKIGVVLAGLVCGAADPTGGTAWAGGAAGGGGADPFAALTAVSKGELARQNGRQGASKPKDRQGISMFGEATTDAVLADNTVTGEQIRTGPNVIGSGAFDHYAGVGSVLMNSGNNVIMNTTTIVNITLR